MNISYGITILAFTIFGPISGYIYEAQILTGKMPDKHPIKVIILSDFHDYSPASITQRTDFIDAIRQFDLHTVRVYIEDNCHYTGTDRIVRRAIEKRQEETTDQFLSFLVEECQQVGIPSENVDIDRYHRENRHSPRAFEQELRKARRRIENYGDHPLLQQIYQNEMQKEYTSRERTAISRAALDPRLREDRLDDVVHDMTRKKLKSAGLLAPEIAGAPVIPGRAIIAPTPEDTQALIARASDAPADPQERCAYNAQMISEIERMQAKMADAAQTAKEAVDAAEDELEYVKSFTGNTLLDITTLHHIYTLPPEVTTVVICIGTEHAKNIATILKKRLDFRWLWSRGSIEYKHIPLDIRLFFKHYLHNLKQLPAGTIEMPRRPIIPFQSVLGKRKADA